MNPLKTIVFFLFVTSFSFSQTETLQDTLLASQYFKKADSLLTERKLDSSIVYFKKALPIYERANAWERVAGCYNKISETYFEYSKYQESLNFARSALDVCDNYLGKNNLEKASAYDNIGQYYLKKADLDNARKYFEKAQGIFLIKEYILGISKSHNNIGQIYTRKAEFDKARSEFDKAIKIDSSKNNPHIGYSYNNLARISYIKGEYKESIEFMKKAILLEISELGANHPKVGGYYNNIGTIYERLGEDDQALSYYKNALAIQLKVSGENHVNVAAFYNNISKVLEKRGDFEGSIKYLEKAIKIRSELFGENHPDMAKYYNNISYLYVKEGLFNKSLLGLKKSLSISKDFLKEEDPLMADIYNNMAISYIFLDELDEGLRCASRALNININNFGEEHPEIARNYINIARIYSKKGEFDMALVYQEKSKNIRSKIIGDKNIYVATNYLYIGGLQLKKGEYDSALKAYIKALNIYKNKLNKSDYLIINCYNTIANLYFNKGEYQNAIIFFNKAFELGFKYIDKVNNRELLNNSFSTVLFSTIVGKAKSHKALYIKKNNVDDLNNSDILYQKGLPMIIHIREGLNNYKDRLVLSKEVKEAYQGAIETKLLIEKRKDKKMLDQAFYYSEKSKSNTLKGLLNESSAKEFSGLSKNLVELEKEVRIDKAYYQSRINEELSKEQTDSIKMMGYESKLFDISKSQDSLTEVLETNYPKYHQLKYNNKVVSVTDIQQKLDEKTTLLEFFTADSITYAFTISKNKIAVKELSTPALIEQIEQFRASMTKNYEQYQEISYQLYQTLITPIKNKLVGNQLIIVPDGPLWHLNFDLLLTEEEISNNPRTWPYLLKEYAISYANSATLLFGNKMREESVSKEEQECLAFSFSSGDNTSATRNVSLKTFRNSSMDLPGTREEIKAIANIVDGQYFYGSEATEENFKKHAGAYDILHLALHGDVDNERPENSKLYFTKSKDTIEDNYLYSHELFALDIPAELTVLSACNTGTGKIAKGEGIMSLGNAFQYAGTKSLLLTNWEVSDETTPKIMEYFYTNLKEGKNKAEALQQAKLQFLTTTSEETYHPYYWGGFYLLGDTTAIQFQDNNHLYWWIGIGILALILLSLFWYRKKRSSSEVSAKAFLS
ncbi:CHAT domain-containing tetratricopeptide repeat protein [uncultured Aquimarina sp.]|uniref:CHAT domain-containing protein n=1 Tax=uncultured Aquimarina sp. TaxID=575652 RepID=UPI002620B9E8|nr:CHAT domain-containing tetratricopeptide repeat protein [uncultured Aquimarina sp.]